MPETPEQFYERVRRHQQANPSPTPPAIAESEISPYEAVGLKVKPLEPYVDPEPPRGGESGPCGRCTKGAEGAIWTNDRWMLIPMPPLGIPWAAILWPREHGDLGDLSDAMAAEMGQLLAHLDRAVMALGNIGRMHVHRWGDGAAHLHLWLLARPYGQPQLRGSYLQDWMSLLPPVPTDQWWADQTAVAQTLVASVGGTYQEPGQ